jgi:oxygen-independent coproporphyrinogen III oxidase
MEISAQFLEKYNRPGPRYTSYPPATSFTTEYGKDDYIQSLIDSNKGMPENISIYIHIPFCKQRCFFCGCNTTGYENDEKIRKYINCLIKEIETVSHYIDKSRKVTQIHWGGGTPNSISFDYIREVMDKIKSVFILNPAAEIAIECNPAYLEFEQIDELAEMGFNRISLGVQDFHDDVLKAVNRKPSKYPIEQLFARMKQKGFSGNNIDLIYGLPLQTLDSFEKNLQKAIEISPDRLVTFSYAYVPWFNEEQRKMEKYPLPGPEEKLSMLILAFKKVTEQGYEFIGLDHFSKPSDELAIAKREKKLHRNFQGYCTRETTGQVYSFGASSISQLWDSYTQNIKNFEKYMTAIEESGFAVERGYRLTDYDKIRREVINEIMCNGYLNLDDVAVQFGTNIGAIKNAVAFDPEKFAEFVNDGLMSITGNVIQVNTDGMLVVRNIAMAFDPMLESTENKFSKTV